jgi:glutaredoxin
MRRLLRAVESARAQRGPQRNHAAVVCACLAVLALIAGDLSAEEARVFYKYTDDTGRLHIVQSVDRVPPQYRNQLGEIALEGEPQWIKSTAPKPALQPTAKYDPEKRSTRRRSSGVVLYYADWCSYCKKAKRWLDERDVRYVIRDIDNARYAEELLEVSGSKSVPVLSVRGELVRGFRPSDYEQALGD